jgi:hypothetical protein
MQLIFDTAIFKAAFTSIHSSNQKHRFMISKTVIQHIHFLNQFQKFQQILFYDNPNNTDNRNSHND